MHEERMNRNLGLAKLVIIFFNQYKMSITFFHDDGDEIDIRRAFEFDSLQAIMPYCPIHFHTKEPYLLQAHSCFYNIPQVAKVFHLGS